MKGYEQVGGVDFVVDIDVDEEDGDADGAEEGQENNDEEAPKDGMNDDLIDDDLAIDELDKANLTTKEKATGSANRTKSSAFSNALCSDSNHENFIMECVVSAKQLSHVSPPVEMLDISTPCLKDMCHASPCEMETDAEHPTNITMSRVRSARDTCDIYFTYIKVNHLLYTCSLDPFEDGILLDIPLV